MPATVDLRWDPSPLNRALLAAFRPSVYEAKAVAIEKAPTRKAGATVKRLVDTSLETARAELVPTGLGFVFEKGREGGYPITPGGVAGFRKTRSQKMIGAGRVAEFGTGRFYNYRTRRGGGARALQFTHGDMGHAAYAIGGKMKADPYVGPAAQTWAVSLYPATARRTCTAAGYSAARRFL